MVVDGPLSLVSLTNDGSLQGAGILTNTSTFSNSAGGVINATNSGGTLVISNLLNNNAGGIVNIGPTSTLSITSSWTNSGIVNLQGASSRLSGGLMTNNGTIQGFGIVTSGMTTSNS